MAQTNSFDIVSEVDLAEVKNAVNQAMKEVVQRYDLKGSDSEIELDETVPELSLKSKDEYTLSAITEILKQKLHRRGVSLKALTYGTIEPGAKESVRQKVTLQQGIPTEKAKEIVKFVKSKKIKVQVAIQGETLRVSGKDRDTLQEVITAVKAEDFDLDMQFTNYR